MQSVSRSSTGEGESFNLVNSTHNTLWDKLVGVCHIQASTSNSPCNTVIPYCAWSAVPHKSERTELLLT